MAKHLSPHWSKNPVAVKAVEKLTAAMKALFKEQRGKIAAQIAGAYGRRNPTD
jgi:hypothetical protein